MDVINLATINFCAGGNTIERLPEFNNDYNDDYRIGEESPDEE